ncbi:hypothetical protein EJB05_26779, partial [Eragrostis curvula]
MLSKSLVEEYESKRDSVIFQIGAMLYELVTSFIYVAKPLSGQRETTQRQLNVEKKLSDVLIVDSLKKILALTHENITYSEQSMRKIFTGLFMHHYRDIDPETQMSCVKSLGIWVVSYPTLFLQYIYLKYLGWTLNDKNAGVRRASILALQSLLERDALSMLKTNKVKIGATEEVNTMAPRLEAIVERMLENFFYNTEKDMQATRNNAMAMS